MTPQEEFADLLEKRAAKLKYAYASTLFPDIGPLRRELYPRHMDFFEMGLTRDVRAFIASNQSGKSTAGCYELGCHLTGIYPKWWPGRRFTRPIKAWALSNSSQTTRDGIQEKLIGTKEDMGTGIILREHLGKPEWIQNGACDKILIRHISGGWSHLGFKYYEQGRDKLQAVKLDAALMDEEPKDHGVFTEVLTRTAASNGIIMATFTPLFGATPLVLSFIPELGPSELTPEQQEFQKDIKSMGVVMCAWDDVPHLTEKSKAKLLANYKPHERQARSTGMPSITEGSVYPVDENDILCKPFPIPDHWPRVSGMDPGGMPNGTGKHAGLFMAHDRQSDVIYFYSEYYRGWAEPSAHAAAMKARGSWIPCVSDDAQSIETGRSIIAVYKALGMKIRAAQKSDRDARIGALLDRFATRRAMIFTTCPNLLMEFRLHRVDEKGKYVGPCHLLNCAEYIVQSGLQKAEMMHASSTIMKLPEPETFGLPA